MQNVVQFKISNLIANLTNLANFFGQFVPFCSYYPCLYCNRFFTAIGTALNNKIPNIFNDNAKFFCMDIANAKNQFSKIGKNEGGIFIVFDRTTVSSIKHVGFSTKLHRYVYRIMNKRNGTLLNNQNISNCSIFFLCLSLSVASNFGDKLKKLSDDVRNFL